MVEHVADQLQKMTAVGDVRPTNMQGVGERWRRAIDREMDGRGDGFAMCSISDSQW
jgi:hypothetical protein